MLVRNYRQCLEGRGRKPGRLALEHKTLYVRRQLGMALEPVATRHLDQDETPLLALVRPSQLVAQTFDLRRRHFQKLRQHAWLDRRVSHHEDGFDGPPLL